MFEASVLGPGSLIGIVRFHEGGDVPGAMAALVRGGIEQVEVTIDTPGALAAVAAAATAPWYDVSRDWDPVARMQHIDLFTWLRGDILTKADKVTMANSLELRVPFLDTEVFEVAASIPLDQKLAGGTTKYALRKALAKIIPAHVLNRPKLGFPVPIRVWLRNEMYDWARGVIADSKTEELLDKNAVLALLEEHKTGPMDRSRQLWALLVFMLWHGIFVENRIKLEIPEPVYPVKL